MYNKVRIIEAHNYIPTQEQIYLTQKKEGNYSVALFNMKGFERIKDIGINASSNISLSIQNEILYVSITSDRCFYKVFSDERIKKCDSTLKKVTPTFIVTQRYSKKEDSTKAFVDILDQSLNQLASFEGKTGSVLVYNEKYIVFQKYLRRHQIECINIEDKIKQTIFDASPYHWVNNDKEEFSGLICQEQIIQDNCLLIHLAKYKIICLGLDSREILWSIDDFVNEPEYKKYLAFEPSGRTPMKWHLTADGKKMCLLARHFYWELNLEERKVSLKKDFLDQEASERWNFTRTRLVAENIFFAGTKGFAPTSNTIGIFDLKSKAVVWEYKIEDGYFVESPQKYGDNLFVMDDKKRLHIFQTNNTE